MRNFPRTWIEIDLSALSGNLAWIKSRLPDGTLLGLVAKADAYGHGLVPVARHASASGADWICVATVQEGVSLRETGIGSRILVLSPPLAEEAEQAVFYDLDISVESAESAAQFSHAASRLGRQARLHLEVDTGLRRFGCKTADCARVAGLISRLPSVVFAGLSQHFVDSGGSRIRTLAQKAEFEVALGALSRQGTVPELIHAANSAGALKRFASSYGMVRTGIVAYGIDPYDMTVGNVKPVLNWKARVIALREAHSGDTVGYCETFRVKRTSRIATLGVGYGDGYPRSLSNVGQVAIHGKRAPVVGLVCMDQMMIDVTEIANVQLGDEVELVGLEISVVDLAQWAKSNCHEIVTRIMPRVPRRYLRSSGSSQSEP